MNLYSSALNVTRIEVANRLFMVYYKNHFSFLEIWSGEYTKPAIKGFWDV